MKKIILIGIALTCTSVFTMVDIISKLDVQNMSLNEKIGQLFCVSMPIQANQQRIDAMSNLIKEYHIGSVILHRHGSPERVLKLGNALRQVDSNLLIFLDAEWGLNMRLPNAMRFPRNMTLGAIKDNRLIYQVGREIGRQLKCIGINVNCAPVVDINNNPNNPVINDRSFGEDPQQVIIKSLLFMQGLQEAGILASAKHFSGHGDTATDSHLGLPILLHDKERLENVELRPFQVHADNGITAIMTSHMAVPTLTGDSQCPITFSRNAIDYLRNKIEFDGLVITDGLNMQALHKYFSNNGLPHEPGDIELNALLAGHDILVMAENIPAAIDKIKKAISNGSLTESELDAHVTRILRAKASSNGPTQLTNSLQRELFNGNARTLKKKLYSQAVTLVANTLIPVADKPSMAYLQVGGTRESAFQHQLENLLPNIESEYINAIPTGPDMTEVQTFLEPDETIIVGIFEMNKFAGRDFGIAPDTFLFLETLKAKGKKLIVCLFGSPYALKFFDDYDTVVMAYEDDIDAQIAGANIIAGKQKAMGKLPVTASDKYRAKEGIES